MRTLKKDDKIIGKIGNHKKPMPPKADDKLERMIAVLSKILEKEVPAPVANVTVESPKVPVQPATTIKGTVTKRDADGFMEDFELEIIR